MSQLTAAIIGFTSSIKSSRCLHHPSIFHGCLCLFSVRISFDSVTEITQMWGISEGKILRAEVCRSVAGEPRRFRRSIRSTWKFFSFVVGFLLQKQKNFCEHFCIFERMKNGWNPTQKSWKQASNIYMKQLLAPLFKQWLIQLRHQLTMGPCHFSLRRLQDLRGGPPTDRVDHSWRTICVLKQTMEIVSYGKFKYHIWTL